jgi:cytochrome c-type biogenesis protein
VIELSLIGLFTAFGAGVISFLSPCVLPLVPGYVSWIGGVTAGQTAQQRQLRELLSTLLLSFCFVLGFTTVFVAFGASASYAGQWLAAYRQEMNIAGGVIIIVFGLFISGLLRFRWLEREVRYYGNLPGGPGLGAYLLGLAFAFGWTPCIGPILGAILTLSATTSSLVSDGSLLLAVYSLGLGIPFMLAALFTERFTRQMQRLKRQGLWLQRVAGLLMIVMGVAMITGYLTDFSIWILKTFPWLGNLG